MKDIWMAKITFILLLIVAGGSAMAVEAKMKENPGTTGGELPDLAGN